MNKGNVSVIIPAYQPDEKLIHTAKGLIEAGFTDILVVDDGSGDTYGSVFEEIEKMQECTLLRHSVNRGKGAALKTAISYFLNNRPDKSCVVTVDADGQHLVKDIEAVALTALTNETIVLGVRDFSDPGIPARSIMGNRITCVVFRIFFGMKIKDTQTGLRAFPKKYLQEFLTVEGDRYEYETNVLFLINRCDMPFEQINITTVYIDENKSSHFRVVRDSVRIYALILKYLFSSSAAAVIDELVFFLLKSVSFLKIIPIPLTFTAAIVARIISSLVNYGINAKHVFRGQVNRTSFVRYYILAAVQIICSAALVFLTEQLFSIVSLRFFQKTNLII